MAGRKGRYRILSGILATIIIAEMMIIALWGWPGFLTNQRVKIKDGHEIVVSEGTFKEKTKVKIESVDIDEIPCEDDLQALDVISLKAENGETEFNQDVTVRFQLPEDVQKDDYLNYVCGYYNGEEWEYILPEGYTFDKGYVEFGTPHFSTFALFKGTGMKYKEKNKAIDLYADKMAHENLLMQYKAKELKPIIIETLDSMGINNSTAQGVIIQNMLKDGKYGNMSAILIGAQNGDAGDIMGGLANSITEAILDAEKNDVDFAKNIIGTGTAATASAIQTLVEDGDYKEAYKSFVYSAMDAIPVTKYGKIAVEVSKVAISAYDDYSLNGLYKNFKTQMDSRKQVDDNEWDIMCEANHGGYTELLRIRKEQYQKILKLSKDEMEDRDDEFTAQIEKDLRSEFAARYEYEQKLPEINAEKERLVKMMKEYSRDYFDIDDNKYFPEEMDISTRVRYIMSARNKIIRLVGGDETFFGEDEYFREFSIKEAVKVYMDNRKDLSKFYDYMEEKGYIKGESRAEADAVTEAVTENTTEDVTEGATGNITAEELTGTYSITTTMNGTTTTTTMQIQGGGNTLKITSEGSPETAPLTYDMQTQQATGSYQMDVGGYYKVEASATYNFKRENGKIVFTGSGSYSTDIDSSLTEGMIGDYSQYLNGEVTCKGEKLD